LGKQFHTAYTQRNLQFLEMKLSERPYNRPKGPFQEHQVGKPLRIGCSQYKCRRFWLRETTAFMHRLYM